MRPPPEGQWIRRAVERELLRSYEAHGTEPWGRHEFYAILLEEVEELWSAIRLDASTDRVLAEMVQVVAVIYRYHDAGNRYGNGL